MNLSNLKQPIILFITIKKLEIKTWKSYSILFFIVSWFRILILSLVNRIEMNSVLIKGV